MTAHKKELERNTLAQGLGRALEGLKHGPSRGVYLVGGAVVVVALVVLLWRYFSASADETASARWLRLDDALFGAELDALLQDKDLQGTAQGRQAKFKEARRLLAQGLAEVGDRRGDAAGDIKKAADLYDELLGERGLAALQQQEALLGAAKGREALGELDRAKALYERLAKEHGDTAAGKDAKEQLARLNGELGAERARELAAKEGSPVD